MKKIILSLVFIMVVVITNAQQVYNSSGGKYYKKTSTDKNFWDRDNILVGGDFRFTGGSGFLSLGVAPMFGYKLMKNLFAGVQLGYNYDKLKIDPNYLPAGSTTNTFNFNAYTTGLWMRYLILQSIYLQAGVEYNFFDTYVPDDITGLYHKITLQSPSVPVGIGFRQPVNNRISLNTTLLYDILNDPQSYYQFKGNGGIDFRIGVLVGF